MEIVVGLLNTVATIAMAIIAWKAVKAASVANELSRKALVMNTVPTLMIRPSVDVPLHMYKTSEGKTLQVQSVVSSGSSYNCRAVIYRMKFVIENCGRGIALSISNITINGCDPFNNTDKTPKALKVGDNYVFEIIKEMSIDDWFTSLEEGIPIKINISYKNDQNNINCNSMWEGSLRPYSKKLDGKKKCLYVSKPPFEERRFEVDYDESK